MSGQTATPWAVDPDHRPGMGWNVHVVQAADPDNRVCFMTSGPEGKINAAFIVTACNSHADLVKALEQISNYTTDDKPPFRAMDRDQMASVARAALATLTARKVG